MSEFTRLFEPGKIGRITIKNRIVLAAMGIGPLIEPDGRYSQRAIDYFAERAKGGVGLITTGSTRVSLALEHNPHLALVDSGMHLSGLDEMADAMHDHGSKVALQLTAGWGRVTRFTRPERNKAVAPSALPCYWYPDSMTRELTREEIKRFIEAFEFAAGLLYKTGIDAIEIHGHEGYLFDQFKTSLWNQRKDEYGGDLDGRLRFTLEVIEAIKRGAGRDFPIIYRFGITHYLEGGREIQEGLEIARRLETAGVDALHIDAGCYENTYWPHPSEYQPRGCMIDLAEMTKREVTIPVIAVGKLGYPELAEAILSEGKADFIALGRPLLADPEWPNKVKAKILEDIRPCIGDYDGCHRRLREHKYTSCTVNPAAGMEKNLAITSAECKKLVAVVGGGPAGMEAARIAALRGHKVVLYEKRDALGGHLIAASVPDFKREHGDLISYFSTQLKKLGVNVKLGEEATQQVLQTIKPEVLFLATGSVSITPDICGVEGKNVITAVDLLLGEKQLGGSAIVLGGGIIGSETALYLAQRGIKTTVIEIMENIARDMFIVNRMHLLELLKEVNVEILTNTEASQITTDGITVTDNHNRERTLPADTIVLAVGLKSDNALAKSLRSEVPEVYSIGDCVQPRRVINAIWEGYRTARVI